MRLFADYHTHTRHSHGYGTVAENVRAALARGLEEVAITDHGPRLRFGLGVRDAAELLRIRDEVDAINAMEPGIRVLVGVEANVISMEGELDVPREILDRLDIVLCGLHPQVITPTWGDALRLTWQNTRLGRISERVQRRAREDNTRALVAALYRNEIDIITHPGLWLPIDTAELARACAARGTCLEISAGHPYVTVEFVKIAAREGVNFAIGSDAHRPEHVGRFERGVAVAEAAGLDPARIINARVS